MIRQKLAAQLYTLRNELKQDFPGVLRELKKMGWAAVQIDGLHDNRTIMRGYGVDQPICPEPGWSATSRSAGFLSWRMGENAWPGDLTVDVGVRGWCRVDQPHR